MEHVNGRQPAEECGREHHTFDADVDDARTFAEHAGKRAERERCCDRNGRCEHAGNDQNGALLRLPNHYHRAEENDNDEGDETETFPIHVDLLASPAARKNHAFAFGLDAVYVTHNRIRRDEEQDESL